MYEIIDGHRRYVAARLAGAQRVPVTVVTSNMVALVAMLVTACQRQDLSAAEKARAMGPAPRRARLHSGADRQRNQGQPVCGVPTT